MMNKLKKLGKSLADFSELLIIPHNDPDPDAIATAVGLQYLVAELYGIKARIGYRGIIGRAENKALISYLKHPLHKLKRKNFLTDLPVALVDTQPGVGNNPLPQNKSALIVIDHHTWQETTSGSYFVDVRPDIGSSSTIISEYLRLSGLEIPPSLANVLFYGIKTDTLGLGRGASPTDAEAYFFLQPKVDVDALLAIEQAQVAATYFKSLSNAFESTLLYDDDLAISYLGVMKYPDLCAEIADILLRLRGVMWVMCMGQYKKEMSISIRTRSKEIGAGKLVLDIVGDLGSAGGHGTMAGGQIPLRGKDPKMLSEQLANKAIQIIKGDAFITAKTLF